MSKETNFNVLLTTWAPVEVIMSKATKRQIKWSILLSLPIALVIYLKALYVSTPQYAFNSFLTAVRESDEIEIKRFSTATSVKKMMSLQSLQLMETEISRAPNLTWGWLNPTRVRVNKPSPRVNDESYGYECYLQKTSSGWQVDSTSLVGY